MRISDGEERFDLGARVISVKDTCDMLHHYVCDPVEAAKDLTLK